MKLKGILHLKEPIYVRDDIFDTDLYIFYGVNPKEFLFSCKNKFGLDFTEDITDEVDGGICAGICQRISFKGNFSIIVWTQRKDINVVGHEVSHAVYRVLERYGIKLNDSTTELFAAYTGMLIEKILGRKRK